MATSGKGMHAVMSEKSKFWVYENWRAQGHKAVIHRSSCAFCNSGRGLGGGTSPSNGRWIGPHPSEEAARAAAARTGGQIRPHRCL
jgi:hypothetical protein